jgi:hypothetical protein
VSERDAFKTQTEEPYSTTEQSVYDDTTTEQSAYDDTTTEQPVYDGSTTEQPMEDTIREVNAEIQFAYELADTIRPTLNVSR